MKLRSLYHCNVVEALDHNDHHCIAPGEWSGCMDWAGARGAVHTGRGAGGRATQARVAHTPPTYHSRIWRVEGLRLLIVESMRLLIVESLRLLIVESLRVLIVATPPAYSYLDS